MLLRILVLMSTCALATRQSGAGEILGVSVIPHTQSTVLRYRRPPDPALAARVQLFIRGRATPGRFDGKTPEELLASGEWAWHNLATIEPSGDEDALCVWEFNGKTERWGVGQEFAIEAEGLPPTRVVIRPPTRWISSINFPPPKQGGLAPDHALVWIRNETDAELDVKTIRLWMPQTLAAWSVLKPATTIPATGRIAPHDLGFLTVDFPPLPLTSCDVAVEIGTSTGPLWARVRARSEWFDISGGWVGDHLREEPYLRLLKHLHVNTGHLARVPGYTDNPEFYARYPLKMFNRFEPIPDFDPSELHRIHAVEFLGEPQYGGGRPVPPQQVFDALLPYRSNRLATTVTHSDERVWRWYAGLSDFPHFDAYRVVAPAADAWRQYDRWGGRKIGWAAPLETIGDLTRSLRDLNRPMPIAAWSQGPHSGWDDAFSARKRRSPTPDELRAQALHALAARVTSLYWFNLSLESLMAYPDTWEPVARIGREIRMLDPFLISGDAYRFERIPDAAGGPGWELSSIVSTDAAVLFALDVRYEPDPTENVFRFNAPRAAEFAFRLPDWLRNPKFVFRVDADGVHDVAWRPTETGVVIDDTRGCDAIYIATRDPTARDHVEARRSDAVGEEARNPIDLDALKQIGLQR